jgi:hypothetical protein
MLMDDEEGRRENLFVDDEEGLSETIKWFILMYRRIVNKEIKCIFISSH